MEKTSGPVVDASRDLGAGMLTSCSDVVGLPSIDTVVAVKDSTGAVIVA